MKSLEVLFEKDYLCGFMIRVVSIQVEEEREGLAWDGYEM